MAGELALQAGFIGFMLGLPGIVSIGPQNLRVLHAGLAGAYPGAMATTAFLSEILLVAACIGGLGLSLVVRPDAVALLQAAGAAFVAWWASAHCFGATARRSAERKAPATAA